MRAVGVGYAVLHKGSRLRLLGSFRSAARDGSVRDFTSDVFEHGRVEDAGDNVLGAELVLAHGGSDRFGCGELHRLVDLARANVEDAAEEAGEAEDVVDLVGVVGAP